MNFEIMPEYSQTQTNKVISLFNFHSVDNAEGRLEREKMCPQEREVDGNPSQTFLICKIQFVISSMCLQSKHVCPSFSGVAFDMSSQMLLNQDFPPGQLSS